MLNYTIDSRQYCSEIKALEHAFGEAFGDRDTESDQMLTFTIAILGLLQDGTELLGLFDETTEMEKIDRIVGAFRTIQEVSRDLHFSAYRDFVTAIRENLEQTFLSESNDGKIGKVGVMVARYDWPMQKILGAVLGGSTFGGAKIRPVKELIELKAKHNKKPGVSGDKHIKAEVMHICRRFWEQNRGMAAPRWLNDTDTDFEKFLRATLGIFPKFAETDLKNIAKAYNEIYPG